MRKNEGSTLIELVACVALFSVVSMAALGFLSFSVNTYSVTLRDTKAMFSARLIAHGLDGLVKNGTTVQTAMQGETVVLSAETEGGTREIQFVPSEHTLFYFVPVDEAVQKIPLSTEVSFWDATAENGRVRLRFGLQIGEKEYAFHLTEMGAVEREIPEPTETEISTEPATEPESETETQTEPESTTETVTEEEHTTELVSEPVPEQTELVTEPYFTT